VALADELGLDRGSFQTCLDSGRSRERVQASNDFARQAGYEGTPTYVINGRVTSGAIPIERWEELFALYAAESGVPVPSGSGTGGSGP